jgi:deoxyribodipyrimidine photolyase-related protein
MEHTKTALILYPNQLFTPELLPKADIIFVVEDPLFFGADNEKQIDLHNQKLILHRASMRRYVEETLWQKDLNVEYIELKDIEYTADVLVRAQKAGAELVMIFDPTDHTVESRLKKALDGLSETPFELRVLPSPSFMLKRGEIRDYFSGKSKHKFSEFYQWQRERFNILIGSDYKPVGGRWMFDITKPMVLPESQVPPGFKGFGDNNYVKEAKKWLSHNFSGNPGSIDNFFWPTSHREAKEWLNDFIEHRLESFGSYDKTIDGQAVFLFHSGISSSLNTGLLTPKQVIETVLAHHAKHPFTMATLESFIRQIIGWREYVRGLYVTQNYSTKSFSSSTTKALHPKWWTGETGLTPFDDVAKTVLNHAYCDDSERLNIVANLMILCEIHPQEVYKWFSSLFIDAYDWVVAPNVYNALQLSDMGGIWPKPTIGDSEMVLSLSHYKRDNWCDVWDGLYWEFIDRHKNLLAKDNHTHGLQKNISHIPEEHRRITRYRAEDFLASIS